jgi:hypothetical protein
LTKITIEIDSSIVKENPKSKKKKITGMSEKKLILKQEKPQQPFSEKQGCLHYFGYLGERSKKEKIPETCIICEKIVRCMLKNVTK